MEKKILKKNKEVDKFLKDVDYSSTPLLIDLLDKHCLFFDSELKAVMKCVCTLNDICKRVYKRFERRESIQIAPSVARYVEFDNEISRYPHLLFNFTSKKVRICIVRIKHRVHILCINYVPNSCARRRALEQGLTDERLYGSWSEVTKETIECWLDVVFEYCSKELEVLF